MIKFTILFLTFYEFAENFSRLLKKEHDRIAGAEGVMCDQKDIRVKCMVEEAMIFIREMAEAESKAPVGSSAKISFGELTTACKSASLALST